MRRQRPTLDKHAGYPDEASPGKWDNGVHLVDIDFTNCVFTETDFINATLTNCRFEGAALTKCWFPVTTLVDCAFHDSALSECWLSTARLIRAWFTNARLTSCWFANSVLEDTTFFGAWFTGDCGWPQGFDPIEQKMIAVEPVVVALTQPLP